ncbi:MAG: hypothetical protein ACOWYE_16130 [Desulfatiglandales bacterium]
MESTKRILLYGNSVILGMIEISLGLYSQFEVTKLIPPLQETQKLDAAKTDIILFDLETTHPEAVLSLLEINPTLHLIGISPDINLVKVWTIRELREVSMHDLLQVIKSEAKDLPGDHSGRARCHK